MFNSQTLNSSPYNTGTAGITGTISGDTAYGSFILHKTDFIHLSLADIENGGKVDASTYAKPDIDGDGLNSYFIRSKTVTLEGTLKADTKEQLETRMQTMLGALAVPNRSLQIIIAGTYFRAPAYCTNLGQVFDRKHFHNTFVPFTVTFQINAPFRESVVLNSSTYAVTATLEEEIINTGTAKAEPIVTISMTSATAITGINVTFGAYVLNLTKALVTTDIVRIDSVSKTVLVNGIESDYTGRLPLLETWSNPFSVEIIGTAYAADISVSYRDKFI